MAGIIVVDRIESDASYVSKIELASPVLISNTFAIPAGSAAAPAITPTGDPNTGIFFPAADNIGFATNGVIRGRWTTDGLCFGSDTAAANALDDYEEGTFTPGLEFGGSSAGVTFTRTTGRYTKIGRLVYCQLHIQVSNNGSGTGSAVMTGLPFTVADLFPNTGIEGSGFCSNWSGAGTNCSGFFFNPLEGTTTAAIEVNPASGTNTAAATDTNLTNSWNIRGLVIYPAT